MRKTRAEPLYEVLLSNMVMIVIVEEQGIESGRRKSERAYIRIKGTTSNLTTLLPAPGA